MTFAKVELGTWFQGLAGVARGGPATSAQAFDEAAVDAEMLAEATTDVEVAAKAVAMDLHLVCKFAWFVAQRAAAARGTHTPGDPRELVGTYTGAQNAFERFGAACLTALHNMERAGLVAASNMSRADEAIASLSEG